MIKSFFICFLVCLMLAIEGLPQSSTQPTISNYSYYPPSSDKDSWQRLNLMLSAHYFRVVKEGEIDFDSCLLYVSRSLGLSRLPILAEGIDDPELLEQSRWVDRGNPAEGLRLLSKVTGKKRAELLLLLGAYYAFQSRSNFRSDSVEYFLFKAIDEARLLNEKQLQRQALCLHAKMYFEINEFERGDSIFARLIQECEVAGDRETEARAWEYRASFPDYDPATSQNRIAYFKTAAALYHELNNLECEINALTNAGYLLVTTGDLQTARDAFIKALQLAESINYPYIHYNTDALAMVTLFDGKFGEPLKYTLQTIKCAETTRDSIGWPYFYSRLAFLYQTEGQKEDENLKWCLKALDRFVTSRDPALYAILYNITDVMNRSGREKEALDIVANVSKKVSPVHPQDRIFYNMALARCYIGLNKYELAEQLAMEADRIRQRSATLRSADQKAIINFLFGQIFFEEKKFKQSKEHFERYLSAPSFTKVLLNHMFAYRRLIAIDSVFNDASSAVNHYKQYNRLLDSNFRASKIRQAEELQVMYQIEEKENQIALLNEQARLKQANLEQTQLVKNVTIAGIIGVLIIAGLLYRQNMLKQRNNAVITHKNEQLQHVLNEKEWLLKEIHHRVKNNLQIVMSLLNSQSAYIDNAPALTAIHDSQHRVHAMSLIHQKLYNTENVSSIDMSTYIRELCSYLADSFNTRQRIRFEFHIEPLELDVGQAVPVGLILNEAITNSIKYAFPNEGDAIITISLSHLDSHRCLLSISDNGIGFPSHFKNKKPGSLGMSLIEGLSEDLEGIFSIENSNGTTIKISFVHDQPVKRPGTAAVSFATN